MLVAVSAAASLGEVVSAFDILPMLLYPYMLLLSSLAFIFTMKVPDGRQRMEKPKPVLTHTYLLCRIEEAYELFENKRDGVIKVAVEC